MVSPLKTNLGALVWNSTKTAPPFPFAEERQEENEKEDEVMLIRRPVPSTKFTPPPASLEEAEQEEKERLCKLRDWEEEEERAVTTVD
jgi:hypothetical protein